HRAVLLERLHGEDHVLDRHRLAVMMARVGAQAEGRRAKVARMGDRFGNEPVVGRYFVERRRQQRVGEDARSCRDRSLQPGDDLVEVVERAQRHQAHAPTLGRARVDVVEMLEARRIFELSEQRQSMLPVERMFLRARRGAEKRRSKSIEDRGESCENAGANAGWTGQPQGSLSGNDANAARTGRITPYFGWLGTDMCAVGPSLLPSLYK